MKRSCVIMFMIFLFILAVVPDYAAGQGMESISQFNSNPTIGTVSQAPGQALIENGSQREYKTSDISAGIPEVSPEQAADKVNRMVSVLYNMALSIAPQFIILIIAFGAIIGIFLKTARVAIFWAILGLVILLTGPQIVGFIHNLAKS